MIQTLANAIGTGAVGELAKQVAGLSTDMENIKHAYAPGYDAKAVDVKPMVALVNGTVHMAQVAGGVLFLEVAKDATWEKGETAITLDGYGTNGDFAYYGGIAGNGGDAAKQCAFDCSTAGGSMQLKPQQAIAESKLHISIPVYKL